MLVIEPCFNLPVPVEISYYGKKDVPSNNHMSYVVIRRPTPFPYENTKVVPRNMKLPMWIRYLKKVKVRKAYKLWMKMTQKSHE